MKKKVVITLYIIAIIIMLKLIYNITINNILINKYNNGIYSEGEAKALKILNFQQKYIAYYNHGNILYQCAQYEDAIKQYKKALEGNIPKYKQCDIRINYALAICKTVKIDQNDKKSIKNAIKTYESAIEILTKKGCANKKDSNGHNKNAQKLKQDIEDEINRLKNLQQNSSEKQQDNDNDEDNQQKQKDNKTKQEIETIETKIQNIKQDATKKQREVESTYKSYNRDYDMKSKNW